MNPLACTLLADGSSDRVLLPVLTWLLNQHCDRPHSIEVAPIFQGSLEDRMRRALDDYPCDILFIHRDAEAADPKDREREIRGASDACRPSASVVTIIPVRMTEAWLLFDERAIRVAAGNPRGAVELDLPPPSRLERLSDPKTVLFDVLRRASELPPQRLRRFQPESRRHRIMELVTEGNFAPLRQLEAFCRLESQVETLFAS